MSLRSVELPLALTRLTSNPMFSTDVIVGKNGQEVRNANWETPLWKFNASGGIKNRADVFALYSFFLTVRGQETAFLLKDNNDFAIPHSGTTPQVIGTADGALTVVPIFKIYYDPVGNSFVRYITRPSTVSADIKVYVNGTLKTYGTHYSVTAAPSYGYITFTSPPANGASISIVLSKFYVPVRFATDELPMDMLLSIVGSGDPYTLSDLPEIPLIEVRD